ncbi:class I SAM-dependent methyltransferase [Vibrio hannami]|uniref:class I SAM-dependent methyltransferase n=1 Tax=Vibrio hannami TaxID=2717094 RepID=UPI002410921B|nr:class I SAM-dependent methyltransferase [Vibrio hannami]MDG3086457.1 class I SAM-dependent methyltransferase [Vibrio hannami]
MSDMYTKHAVKYGEAVKDNIYNAHLERPSTMALLDDVKGKNVIDMGCGSGIYASWLLEQSANKVTCLDLSANMVALTKESLGNNVEAYVQDISEGLPKESDSSADVVICPLVLHYIKELKPVFEDVFRVLKPGGYMVFSTHHPFVDFEYSTSGNYFECEHVNDEWNTIGTPVKVSFYRRSLTELCEAITSSGLVISRLNEGKVNEQVKKMCESTYQRLKNNPNFLFVRCEKPVQ